MTPLDATDLSILSVLARDGRITKAALAEAVGLSPTPCWNRLKRLEKAGVITGYGARFDLKKIGPSVTVFVAVELVDHTSATFRIFEDAVGRYDEVTACWALGGGFDYLCQVVAPDIDAYQRLMDAMLDARIGVGRYFTYIVTKPVKGPGALPLGLIAGEDSSS